MVEHAVRTNLGLAPGLGTEQTGFVNQVDGASQELIQVLDSDLDRALLIRFHGHQVAVGVRMTPQGGEEVTQAPFRGIDTIKKAETFRTVSIALFGQVAQGFSPAPTVGDLPTVEEKDRYRVERSLTSC